MEQKRILALGFFDGVHLGHGALLTACRALADEKGVQAGAVTFTSHPDALVSGKAPGLINTPADRERIMREEYKMDAVIALPFDRAMMTMPWQDFFCLLREKYHAAGLVCGHDFRFGNRGEGNAAILRSVCAENGMDCIVIPQQKLDGVTISSTHIRMLLEQGEMEEAARFLGHPHFLTGEVVGGRHLGHKLGFPTANIDLSGRFLPKAGVYAVRAVLPCNGVENCGGSEPPAGDSEKIIAPCGAYFGIANLGAAPTVGHPKVLLEVHFDGFSGDLYGKTVTVEFLSFLREIQKFASKADLSLQLEKDLTRLRATAADFPLKK